MKVYWWQTVLPHPTRKYLYFALILFSIYSRYKILYCQSLSCSNYRCYFLGFSLSSLYLEDNGYLIIVCFWNLFASALISSDFSIFSCSFFLFLLCYSLVIFSTFISSVEVFESLIFAVCYFRRLLLLMLCFFGCFVISVYITHFLQLWNCVGA